MAQAPITGHGGTESGETLIEILIALILMGVAITGLLAGVFAVGAVANKNAERTHVGNSAQAFAEELKQPIDPSLPLAFTYVDCAPTYPTFSGTLPGATTYSASILDIEYATSLPGPTSSLAWGSTCPADDLGLQLVTIEVEFTSGSTVTTETITIVKRDAACTYSVAFQNTDQGPC